MDEQDQKDIIKKVKTSGADNDLGDKDLGISDNQDDELNDSNIGGDDFDDENIEENSNIFEINDLIELKNPEISDIFVENHDIMDIIKEKIGTMLGLETEPVTKPTTKPSETPLPRRRRIWSPKPAVLPKPKAKK